MKCLPFYQALLARVRWNFDAVPHSHVCPDPNCGHIWTHKADDIHSDEDNIQMHTCPKCGDEKHSCWEKFHPGTNVRMHDDLHPSLHAVRKQAVEEVLR